MFSEQGIIKLIMISGQQLTVCIGIASSESSCGGVSPFEPAVLAVAGSKALYLHVRVTTDARDIAQHQTFIGSAQGIVLETLQGAFDEIITILFAVNR